MSEGSGAQGELENGSHGLSVVQVSIPNQPVQVQSVIQSNQPSVIQTAGNLGNLQTIQVVRVATVDDELTSEDRDADAKTRREILARRPSYRKIFNELSSPDSKMDEESNSSQSQDGEINEAAQNLTSSANTVYQQATVLPSGAIQITTHPEGVAVSQGLQTLTMSNSATATTNAGATIVQYAQGPDGQFYIPGTVAVGGTSVQAYQIATAGALPQGVVVAGAGSPIQSSGGHGEEASRKRELRLLKNRDAAHKCRGRKKRFIECLENRVAMLEDQNKTLIQELKTLKELYCQQDE